MVGNLLSSTTESLALAREARKRKREESKALNLLPEIEFVRSKYWDQAARAVGVARLPDWNEAMTVTRMIQWMNRLGITRNDVAVYLPNDEKLNAVNPPPKFNPARFIKDNPRWPLHAFVGTIIENVGGEWLDSRTFQASGKIQLGDN